MRLSLHAAAQGRVGGQNAASADVARRAPLRSLRDPNSPLLNPSHSLPRSTDLGSDVIQAAIDAGIGAAAPASKWALSALDGDDAPRDLVATRTLEALKVADGARLQLVHKADKSAGVEHHGSGPVAHHAPADHYR